MIGSFAAASFRPLGEVLLALTKSTQKASPEPRCSLWCSQRAGPAQLVSAASLNLLRKLAYTEASPLRGYVFARKLR